MKWKDLFRRNDELSNLTLQNIEDQMIHSEFDEDFRKEIMSLLINRHFQYGEEGFQEWLYQLHFQLPAELENEGYSLSIYQRSKNWFETEIKKLQIETGLSWEKQAEDLRTLDHRVRKVQLVTRHRLAEVVLDLMS
ncbi:MAG: hypothetical protein ACQEUT_18840 [Bacillota bacterium]